MTARTDNFIFRNASPRKVAERSTYPSGWFMDLAMSMADSPRLSIEAKGAAITLFKLTEGFSKEEAKSLLGIGEHIFQRVIRELKAEKIIVRGQKKDASGQFVNTGYRFNIDTHEEGDL